MPGNVLLTGGSGFVGRRLTSHLQQNGYTVSWLSRSGKSTTDVRGYKWDIENQKCDTAAVENANVIIHLAGEGVADKRWSKEQKRKIKESRTKSAQLLFNTINKSTNIIETVISASGAGYYGYDNGAILLSETSRFGDDFLATVVKEWEAAVDQFETIGKRVVKLRISMVLGAEGGALEKIAKPVKWYIGAPLGSGDQYISWIHIDDLCKLIIQCLTDKKMKEAYNVATPNAVTNRELTKQVAKVLHKPLVLPNIPAFVLKLMLGEMATLVLGSGKLSAEKILNTGFKFSYPMIDKALQNLYKQPN